MNTKQTRTRALRVRRKLAAVSSRPRLTIFRSNVHIWAQVIDDTKGQTLVAASDQDLKGSKTERAQKVGENLATLALKKGIKQVVFDRGPYHYHGRVKALAEAARTKGLVI
jgi:large subunit ribosomal protein L18